MWLKRPRFRSETFLAFVRQRSCAHCYAEPPSDPHHWHPTNKGTGFKPDDCHCLALCRACHSHFHQTGTLPGLDPETTRSDFVREQWRTMAEFLRAHFVEPGKGETF